MLELAKTFCKSDALGTENAGISFDIQQKCCLGDQKMQYLAATFGTPRGSGWAGSSPGNFALRGPRVAYRVPFSGSGRRPGNLASRGSRGFHRGTPGGRHRPHDDPAATAGQARDRIQGRARVAMRSVSRGPGFPRAFTDGLVASRAALGTCVCHFRNPSPRVVPALVSRRPPVWSQNVEISRDIPKFCAEMLKSPETFGKNAASETKNIWIG